MQITSRILYFFHKIFENVRDISIPRTCPFCDKPLTGDLTVCDTCFYQINFIDQEKCQYCGIPLEDVFSDGPQLCRQCAQSRKKSYDMVRSLYVYDSLSKIPILKLKHADRTDLAYIFVPWMIDMGNELLPKTDIIAPVPLHWSRHLHRLYNQSDVLGDLLAKKTHKTYHIDLLKRTKCTATQAGKDKTARQSNLRNAITFNKKHHIKGKTILLIDDVFTTGATANTCARELKKHGAKAVYILTIARAILKSK